MNFIRKLFSWLVTSGWELRPVPMIALQDESLDETGFQNAALTLGQTKTVDVSLPAKAILQKEHRVPSAARKKLRSILQLKQETLQESSGTKLVSASTRLIRSGEQLTTTQYFVKASDLEDIKRQFNRLGIQLRRITHKAHQEEVIFSDAVTDKERATKAWWLASLTALLLILTNLNYAKATSVSMDEARLAELRLENADLIAALENRANSLEALAERSQSVQSQVDQLALHQRSFSDLAAVSDLFPQSTWLTEYIFADQSLRLSGTTSDDPIDLVRMLEAQDWVQSVELAQPVRTDRQRQVSNFQFVVLLEGRE